jgi:tyrosyl-tRNA synthetase
MNSGSFLPVEEQLEIIKTGAVDFQVEDELKKKLEKSRTENKPLIVKAGFDPTAPDLHLGHSVLLNKMRQFQLLGHRPVFLIGDFTAKIGDPTGRNQTRPPLSEDEIFANATTYKRQVFKILDPEKTEVRFNSEWLGKMGFDDVIRLAARYSVARMIEREDFRTRLQEGQSISMHELLYPLAQGYDSVALKADIELGATDQLFNLLVGRDLMRSHDLAPQSIMTIQLLEGLDARDEGGSIVGNKMSKSLNNYVGIEEDPNQQFGKLMSICDPLMWRYYDLLSFKDKSEIKNIRAGHPREAKVLLAKEIVARFHNETAAESAHGQFEALFKKGNREQIPEDSPTITLQSEDEGFPIVRALVEAELVKSNSEARRLINQNGLSINGARIENIKHELTRGTHAVRAGKKSWARIVVE